MPGLGQITGAGGVVGGSGAGAGAGAGLAGYAQAGLGLVSTLFAAYGDHKAGKQQQKVDEINASIADNQAQDAIQRGDVAANRRLTQTKQIIGSQRTALAAQGVDVNSGSAADIQANAKYLGTLDAVTIRNNAAREAWGYSVQANNDRLNGEFAVQNADMQAGQTLLTGSSDTILATQGFGQGQRSDYPLLSIGRQ